MLFITPDPATVARLRTKLVAAIRESIKPGTPYALIDWPGYANVGDSALWLGALSLLREVTGESPVYIAPTTNIDPKEATLPDDCVIFINGGGNFGSLWQSYQHNRIRLLKRFPNHRIIQLPQSIAFYDKRLLDQTATAIATHGHFTLMTRDHGSHDFAKRAFDCEVMLCPDTAFGLGALSSNHSPNSECFLLMRRDKERHADTPSAQALLSIGFSYDWTKYRKPPAREQFFTWLVHQRHWRHPYLVKRAAVACERQAEYRLDRGLSMLGRGERVITDRLHGHILSLLLGKPHYVFDNSYGKTFGYINTWYPELAQPVRWQSLTPR